MKKTLAILLAILAAASISLAACSDNGKVNVDDEDDDDEDVDYVNDETGDEDNDTDSDTDKDTDTDDSGNGNNNTNNTADFVAKNDVVYVGMDGVNLRKTMSTSGTGARQVNHKTKLNRISANNKWSLVKLDGDNTEYYVLNDLIATNGNDFEFDACTTPVNLTINGTYQVPFYTTPFESPSSNADIKYANVLMASGVKASMLSSDSVIKKVAVSKSGDWMKISFTGTINFSGGAKTYTDAEFYIADYTVTKGYVADPDRPNAGNGGGTGGGIG